MEYRTRVQTVEVSAAHGPHSDPNRAGVTKLAHRASHPSLVVRRPRPGIPGFLPLRTCSTLSTPRRSGACGTSPDVCCSSPSSAASLSMTSCRPLPTCIAASPIPDANDSRMSAIRCAANLTPMGGIPQDTVSPLQPAERHPASHRRRSLQTHPGCVPATESHLRRDEHPSPKGKPEEDAWLFMAR